MPHQMKRCRLIRMTDRPKIRYRPHIDAICDALRDANGLVEPQLDFCRWTAAICGNSSDTIRSARR